MTLAAVTTAAPAIDAGQFSLSSRALLVSLTIKQWSAKRHDKDASRRIATDAHATEAPDKIGRYSKLLVPPEAIKSYTEAAGRMRSEHYRLTLPWGEDSVRILGIGALEQYQDSMRRCREDVEKATEEFLAAYPALVAGAPARLGELYRAEDYPPAELLRRKFGLELSSFPVPDPQHLRDVRRGMSDEQVQRLMAEVEASVNGRTADAMRSVWDRVYQAVQHMSERLGGYGKDADGKTTGIFRDSVVGNLRELVEILPLLNVTGDSQLQIMSDRIAQSLCVEEAATLREKPKALESVKADADSILRDMAAFIGPGALLLGANKAA